MSCQLSGCPVDLAVSRYLEGDLGVEVPPELFEVHAEQVDKEHRS